MGRDLTHDFFAPTTGTSTARVVESYALENDLCSFTFDAHNAFLHVPEEDLVIVEAPREFRDQQASVGRPWNCDWRMLRTLYGRRSAAQTWTEWIANELSVKTIETKTLWLQERLRDKLLAIVKVAGKINVADVGTKNLKPLVFFEHCKRLGLRHAKLGGELRQLGL